MRTWKAGSEVLHQRLLVGRFVGSVHSRDGQAQDLPQRDELRLTDRRHADRRHITCRGGRRHKHKCEIMNEQWAQRVKL